MLSAQRHVVHLLLGVNEGDKAAARAKNQLALILEHNLDDFVGVAEEDSLLCALPLLDVDQLRVITVLAGRSVLLREAELERFELLVAVEVALEVLQKHYFLID